ncbi:transporter substrate-binding domain-containing protein [Novosphingobium umbonatum]|uniref:Transporter substrate-binding domain-containing protein n=1 Tax=Novosphingobium umbonatum TaxID=1908524 RepID=A0A3S2V9Q1_9SPHN|nr:transporter substrate-binding domain-containing protein [Novosphingobium umbonatum]RVU07160.1 transporter substrate-binding domain-containing protein [Novosphingobium umbonatum]
MRPAPNRRQLLGGLIASLFAPHAMAAPLAKVRELGVLRVGVYKHNRPWSWSEDGVLKGIDVDLAKAFATKLGLRLDIVEFTAGENLSDDLRNVVWRGGLLGFQRCDVMMHVPFERKLQQDNDNVAIAAPYCREGFAAACVEGTLDCEAPPVSWRGKRLAASTTSIGDFYLMAGFGGILRNSIAHFNTGYEAVAALGEGKADAVVASNAEVEAGLKDMNNPKLRRRKAPLPAMISEGWDVGIAVREDSRSLSDAIERVLAAMVKDGALAKIFLAHGVAWQAPLAG